MKIKKLWKSFCILLIILLILTQSVTPPASQLELYRTQTRDIEFDYIGWTFKALFNKLEWIAFNPLPYFSADKQKEIVLNYLKTISDSRSLDYQIQIIYSDPNIDEPAQTAEPFLAEWLKLQAKKHLLSPLSESILQIQIGSILKELNLSAGGQPIPPVLYRTTPLPLALIISPRDVIRQDADISLLADLTTEEIIELEESIESRFDVSALVVPVGGVGIYPTMVQESSNITWVSEVVSHEWTHNFLTLRPLGMSYFKSPELRTINETTANLSGKEIGNAVLAAYYPEYLPQPVIEETTSTSSSEEKEDNPAEEVVFDYKAEMHITRVQADEMLAAGKIKEAETYMERRREFFWENGYAIRRINQAYFAFYGAYADSPGGAAGEDPIGPAVVSLRENSDSLSAFLHEIAWVTSFEELQQKLESK